MTLLPGNIYAAGLRDIGTPLHELRRYPRPHRVPRRGHGSPHCPRSGRIRAGGLCEPSARGAFDISLGRPPAGRTGSALDHQNPGDPLRGPGNAAQVTSSLRSTRNHRSAGGGRLWRIPCLAADGGNMNELAGWHRTLLGPCGPRPAGRYQGLRRLLAALLLASGATAAFAADGPASSPASATANGLDAVVAQSRASAGDNDVLPPDQAFRFAAFPDGPDRVRLVWQIADDYYLYRSRIKIATTSNRAQLGAPQMPAGEIKQDDYFGKQEIYHHQLAASVPVARAAGSALELPLSVTYQGCGRGICYPPIVKSVSINLPGAGATGSASGATTTSGVDVGSGAAAATAAAKVARADGAATPGVFVSDQDRYVSVLREGNIVWVVLAFLGGGILLSFTPCVLPMVPIVSGIIIGDGTNLTARRTFSLSLAYVLGMALTYTAAGIAVAAGGQQVQAAFQQPWVIVLFAALFVVLALSMFGLFTLQMPAAIQTRLATMSNRQSAGSYGGVAIMGALSSLIVTTCVGPALVGALLFIGQSGNMLRGGIALFSMAIGMGVPLLVVGASAGKLLPKAGPWMDLVKRLFGALMLAVAAWVLERIVSDRFSLLLWIVP